jgi:hypothetical protein
VEERSSMTIIEAIEQKKQPYVGKLMKKLISNRRCLELLRFFVAHPEGRFSKLAINYAVDNGHGQPEVENALAQLVNEGVLEIVIENGISFHRLTREEPVRRIVLEMAEFDWRHWQLVLEYM